VEAERSFREAADIAREIYGPDHRETLVAEGNFWWSVEGEGRVADALQGRLAMLPRVEKLRASEPDLRAYTYNYLATDYLLTGRFDEAETKAREALAVWREIHGETRGSDSVAALYTLGAAHMYQGRYTSAQTNFNEVVRILAASQTSRVGQSRGALGNTLRLAHRNRDAVQTLQQAQQDFVSADMASGPQYATVLAQLGEAEVDAGNRNDAVRDAAHAVELAREALPKGNFRLGWPLFSLARAKLALGRAAEAEPLLREALAVRSPPYPAGDPRVLEVEVALAVALHALHQDDGAAAVEAKIEPALAASTTPYAADLRARLAHWQPNRATGKALPRAGIPRRAASSRAR
jgi:serine/threonine-protein kinase